MKLITVNHPFHFECENIIRIFFPMEKIITEDSLPDEETDGLFVTRVTETENGADVYARVVLDGKSASHSLFVPDGVEFRNNCERKLASVLCECLTELTGYRPAWGILTGVRPSKLMRTKIEECGENGATDYFERELEVSPEKTALAVSVAKAEDAVVAMSRPDSCSQYISIPFCPTRCSYCSFVSHSMESAKKLIPDYVNLLCCEIAENARYAERLGLHTDTVYIGGGTPTSVTAQQLKQITDAVKNSIDLSGVREYTVEAGRPDTIDIEKLHVLKEAGVTRISVNPQSFNEKVLENIGRRHTPEDILRAFGQAREVGFDCINMDLIAGLPGDSPAGFADTLEKAIALQPENITVHTLALKRSSTMVTGHTWGEAARETAEMIETAFRELTKAGYFPYYMYRQSKSVGNLENVGWCKPGKEGLYNVFMMEEIHTVLASGGGAVTKLRDPHSTYIERIFNFKYPYEYVSRFDSLLERKERIHSFYAERTNP